MMISLTGNDVYLILGTIADLKLHNPQALKFIIDRYRERRNQYIRAGLYKLLISLNAMNSYIEIFLDGIDLSDLESPVSDRESVNLMDETMFLEMGLKQVKSSMALSKLFNKLVVSESKEIFLSDYSQIISSLMQSGCTCLS
ncbi:MAG: hypothetical protein WKG06_12735 [Segetibacter sp.]